MQRDEICRHHPAFITYLIQWLILNLDPVI
jgi:hypothetical protein